MSAVRAPVRRKALVAVVIIAAIAMTAGYSAGFVFDGPGRFEIGFWAKAYGVFFFVVGSLLAVAALARHALRRVALAVLAVIMLVCATPLWWVLAVYRVPITNLEGAWLYPLAAAFTGGAIFAARYAAIKGRPRPAR